MGEKSYVIRVNSLHKKFKADLKRANSRQNVMNAYWKHKKEHEKTLESHLKEEMKRVNRIKGKIEYR